METSLAPVELSPGELGEVQEADRQIARWTAVRARALAAFAASRPATADRQQGEPGAMSAERWAARPEVLRPVSEWAVPELVIALSRSSTDVQLQLERSLLLVRLPGVLAAAEAGALTDAHLRAFLDLLAPVEDAGLRAEVEAALLAWLAARAAGRRITTPPQLRDKLNRELLRRGAREAAQRALRALRERGVHRQQERGEGMGAVAAVLTEPEAQALLLALEAYADAVEDEPGAPPRTRQQKMADCLVDLVLRPGESAHPPVQVVLTLVASVQTLLGGDEPAELGGRTVAAETARQLLRALTGVADADASAADPLAAGVPGAEPAVAPVAEQLLCRLADWWDDLECRVLAGEAEPGPHRPPDDLLAALDGDLGAELCPDSAAEGGWAAPEEELAAIGAQLLPGEHVEVVDVDGGPRPGSAALRDDAGDDPPRSVGWWADADRAVQDAGRAVLDAQRALGHARRMVHTADRADAADERAWRDGAAGRVDAATGAVEALGAATDDVRQELAGPLARTRGGGLADRPRIALVDELSRALVSLTDLPGLRRTAHCGRTRCRRDPVGCDHDLTGRPGLGAPAPTDGYRPGAALDRFLRARDRRCRFPGCRRPVAKGELDHRVRYPHGPTDVTNLGGLCTGDHRGKHQAPGFSYVLDADQAFVVTTPTGLVAVTDAPPF